MSTCTNCGNPLTADDVACQNCGLAVLPGGTETDAQGQREPTRGRGPTASTGAPRATVSRGSRRLTVGTVKGEPEVLLRPAGGSSILLRLLLLALVVVVLRVVLVDLALTLTPLLVVAVIGFLLVRRVGPGLGALFGMFAVRRGSRSDEQIPWLVFRVENESGITEAQLSGHDHGVAWGDEVAVTGLRIAGAVHALKVRNLTSARALYADGLVRRALMVIAAAALVVGLVATIAR